MSSSLRSSLRVGTLLFGFAAPLGFAGAILAQETGATGETGDPVVTNSINTTDVESNTTDVQIDSPTPPTPTTTAGVELPEEEVTESPDDFRCVAPTGGASPSAVNQFNANPQGLLNRHPLGGLALANEVRTLAVTDVRTVDTLLQLADNATNRQSSAIGAGLARAAATCVASKPQLAEQIQLKVAGSQNETLVTSFLTGAGNQDVAGIPGGGGGGGPTGGGGGAAGIGGSGPGGTSNLGGGSVANAGGILSTGGGGSAITDDDDDDSSAVSGIIFGSVSPTQP